MLIGAASRIYIQEGCTYYNIAAEVKGLSAYSTKNIALLHWHCSSVNPSPPYSPTEITKPIPIRNHLTFKLLADSCYSFIHQFTHLPAQEYRCDGWPVISELSPLWVILPLTLPHAYTVHQSNAGVRHWGSFGVEFHKSLLSELKFMLHCQMCNLSLGYECSLASVVYCSVLIKALKRFRVVSVVAL